MITRLEEFSNKVKDGLDEADWLTKRELIRTLVKQVNVGKEDVTIVFRVIPDPFVANPIETFQVPIGVVCNIVGGVMLPSLHGAFFGGKPLPVIDHPCFRTGLPVVGVEWGCY